MCEAQLGTVLGCRSPGRHTLGNPKEALSFRGERESGPSRRAEEGQHTGDGEKHILKEKKTLLPGKMHLSEMNVRRNRKPE